MGSTASNGPSWHKTVWRKRKSKPVDTQKPVAANTQHLCWIREDSWLLHTRHRPLQAQTLRAILGIVFRRVWTSRNRFGCLFPELLSWMPRLNKCLLLHWLLQETGFPSKLLILVAQSKVNSRENTCCSVWKINSEELQLHKSPRKRLTMKTLHELVRNQFAFQTEERK